MSLGSSFAARGANGQSSPEQRSSKRSHFLMSDLCFEVMFEFLIVRFHKIFREGNYSSLKIDEFHGNH